MHNEITESQIYTTLKTEHFTMDFESSNNLKHNVYFNLFIASHERSYLLWVSSTPVDRGILLSGDISSENCVVSKV